MQSCHLVDRHAPNFHLNERSIGAPITGYYNIDEYRTPQMQKNLDMSCINLYKAKGRQNNNVCSGILWAWLKPMRKAKPDNAWPS